MDKVLYGLSGTHGTGKTTILKGVQAAGHHIIDTSLARAAQKALGWEALSEAGKSVDNMWALQDAVLTAMTDRDDAIMASGIPTMVERTPADLWGYTRWWAIQLGVDLWFQDRPKVYYQKLQKLAARYAHVLVIPAIDAIPFVAEPNRADLASRKFVGQVITYFLDDNNVPGSLVKEVSPDDRIYRALQLLSPPRPGEAPIKDVA